MKSNLSSQGRRRVGQKEGEDQKKLNQNSFRVEEIPSSVNTSMLFLNMNTQCSLLFARQRVEGVTGGLPGLRSAGQQQLAGAKYRSKLPTGHSRSYLSEKARCGPQRRQCGTFGASRLFERTPSSCIFRGGASGQICHHMNHIHLFYVKSEASGFPFMCLFK